MGDKLQALGRLHGTDDSDQRCKHSQRGAMLLLYRHCRWESAGITGRVRRSGVVDADLAIKLDHRARDQGFRVVYTGGVDRVAGLKVVTAIEHDIDVRHQGVQYLRVGPGLQGRQFDIGVEGLQGVLQRLHLGLANGFGAVGDLALQVGQIDRVVVEHREVSNPCASQVHRQWRSQPACANDQCMCVSNALLSFDADVVKQDVARVAHQLGVLHGALLFLFLFLALDLGFAHEHRLAFELVERLGKLKVLVRAKFGRTAFGDRFTGLFL